MTFSTSFYSSSVPRNEEFPPVGRHCFFPRRCRRRRRQYEGHLGRAVDPLLLGFSDVKDTKLI